MNRIFIGFDPRQFVSYTVLSASIIEHASEPVSIAPCWTKTAGIERNGLTQFTYARFMVPAMCDYEGWALFIDADMLFAADPCELFKLADPEKAVIVANLPDSMKFEQAAVMLFNCSHPDNRKLTAEYVTGKNGTIIDWTDSIGHLPANWHVLVGYQEVPEDPKLLHYTQGVPAWPETEASPASAAWRRSRDIAMLAMPWRELMGHSVHAVRRCSECGHAMEQKLSHCPECGTEAKPDDALTPRWAA